MNMLASSVCAGMHPSQMVKMIDSGSEKIPPLYIMPWFFAQKIKHTNRIEIIFPDEGAFISPIQLLVKRSRTSASERIIDFLMSRELHQHCTDSYFPSPHPEISHNFPSDRKLYWIGWDFIYNNDLGSVKKQIGDIFSKECIRSGGTQCI
jgi:ABC-type Fe3+ transport system substrate-binding protein